MSADIELSATVCILCRQRKIKCDRQLPKCGFCSTHNLDCEYVTATRKPGLRAGYVSGLERRIGILERQFAEFKDRHCPTSQGGTDQSPQVFEQDRRNSSSTASSYIESSQATIIDVPAHESQQHDFSYELLSRSCNVWFERYHVWFPILHPPSVTTWLQISKTNPDDPVGLVLKAIASLVLPHLGLEKTDAMAHWSQSLRQEILLGSFRRLSLPGLQALLVLSIRELGNGNISEFWNLIALCKRMSLQLGLRDLVVNFCVNYGQPAMIPPRMLAVPDTVVGCEERVRAFWATEVLDSASTIGTAWNFYVSPPEIGGWTPFGDDIWSLPEGEISMYPFGNPETPSAFSLYVRLVSNELWNVHDFLQQSSDTTRPEILADRRSKCVEIDGKLTHWRAMFESLTHASSPISDIFGPNELRLHNPNIVMTYCTLDSAIISLHQRFVFPASSGNNDIWFDAATRCLECCDQITHNLRSIPDGLLECMNPMLTICVFSAARFYIIHAKTTSTILPAKLSLLTYVMKCLAIRWPFAARLEKALHMAITEISSDHSYSSLPEPFYDLQYVWPDIDESLRLWAVSQHSTRRQTTL